MASLTDAQAGTGLSNGQRSIAIAPGKVLSPTPPVQNVASPGSEMPYACHTWKLECIYQAPQPRKRKRQVEGQAEEGVLSKLARYEQILRDNDLLPDAESGPRTTVSLQVGIPEASTEGTLVTGEGKSRFIDKYLWRPILEEQDEDTAHLTDDEDNAQPSASLLSPMAADPLTGALTGSMRSLLDHHPRRDLALDLWKTHVDHVEPICRVLHIPSADKVVRRVVDQPQLASKAEEALMFAIYHFATCSSSEDDCMRLFGQPKHIIQNYYHAAVKQALVNAKLLKTTDMMVMQAFILFLLSSRHSIDPSTFWILTGVAVRIAQRMGLHRDGEDLGLSPFDVQMRRRLFYQLLPLDGMASQMSGTGISMRPDSWDTKQPVNLNDSDIYPGMTEWPEITSGATDMIFCLARTELGALFAAKALIPHGATWRFRDVETVIQLIDEVETSIETKYVSNAAFTGEPDFIITLRDARQAHATKRAAARNGSLSMPKPPSGGSTIFDPSPESDACALFASIDGLQYELGPDFTLDQANWTFWDQLISGYQPPPLDETVYQ
ncbi:hypothetical protein B0A48_11005 [Cryoendolithus antarcticus]|uniref:Xylanolytic transcriptional activator regulatory domain-containing protein n=1 Tax=Cryoendolithus antarcticus TaxID=1507870 RepID=A0A1V8SZ91_9PEZI|nr:hypothetical protein B0A48_11005 [Cryoendolithus antarcticus]